MFSHTDQSFDGKKKLFQKVVGSLWIHPISFFAIVQIRDFHENTKSMTCNNSKLVSRLKELLLQPIDKYFVSNDVQWNLMKVSFSSNFYI